MIVYRSEPASCLIEIEVSGRIDQPELHRVFQSFRADLDRCGSVRVLELIRSLEGITPAALWEDLTKGAPMARHVERVAVVTDVGWVATAAKAGDLLTPAQVRTFRMDEEEAARAWLQAA